VKEAVVVSAVVRNSTWTLEDTVENSVAGSRMELAPLASFEAFADVAAEQRAVVGVGAEQLTAAVAGGERQVVVAAVDEQDVAAEPVVVAVVEPTWQLVLRAWKSGSVDVEVTELYASPQQKPSQESPCPSSY